jgi:hypothetical protein
MDLEKVRQNRMKLQRGAILQPSELVKEAFWHQITFTLSCCGIRESVLISGHTHTSHILFISGGTKRQGKGSFATRHSHGPQRTVSVKDVICVLEREPQMTKSRLIYRLYERLPGDFTTD